MFQDDNLLLYRGDRTSERTFAELRELGVDRVRLSVPWRALAPAHRATSKPRPLRYDQGAFHPWDHAVRAARARGIEVLFNVTGGAPLWATGKRRGRHGSDAFVPVGEPVFVYDDRGYFETEAPRMTGSWRYSWRGHVSNAVGVYVG